MDGGRDWARTTITNVLIMTRLIRPKVFVASIILTLAIASMLVGALSARAQPSFFIRANNLVCGNFTPTTTPTFITAGGTGTSTAVYDTGCASAGSTDSASFLLQLTGSSTATVANVSFEYSQDNVDWYSDDYNFPSASTTQSNTTLTSTRVYILTYASTTVGGLAGTGNGRNTRIVNVPVPTRYVRAVTTLAPGSLPGAVWGEFVGKRQSD